MLFGIAKVVIFLIITRFINRNCTFIYRVKKPGIWVMPGRLSVKENEMKYSLGPKADCNQANLTDENVCPNLLIPSSIFLAVLADGCL